jgi:hypothetical protein
MVPKSHTMFVLRLSHVTPFGEMHVLLGHLWESCFMSHDAVCVACMLAPLGIIIITPLFVGQTFLQ